MVKRIALIGCGNIGSRHLQALAHLSFSVEISVVEPSVQAQRVGLQRLNQIEYDQKTHIIAWYKNINELNGDFDLTIVATIAHGRMDLIKKLLEKNHSRFLVEKIVCQSTREYDELLRNMSRFNAKGWVNTNYRYFTTYKKIKNYLGKSKLIHISLTTSSNYGLGTTAIHYLDLFSWFTNDYKIALEGNCLHDKLTKNKRGKDLIEFTGSISGTTPSGSSITLTFIPDAKLPLLVNIYGDNNQHISINEIEEKIHSMTEKIPFSYVFEHTSNLTTKIANDIIKKDNCHLSTLSDSYYLHKELFRILCKHLEKLTQKKTEICPIT